METKKLKRNNNFKVIKILILFYFKSLKYSIDGSNNITPPFVKDSFSQTFSKSSFSNSIGYGINIPIDW